MLPVRQNPEGKKSQQIILLLLRSRWRCTVLTQVSNRQLAVFEEILVPKSNLNIKIWGDKLDFENYPISQRKLHPYFPVISFTWTQTIMVINNLCVKQRVGEREDAFIQKGGLGKVSRPWARARRQINLTKNPKQKNTWLCLEKVWIKKKKMKWKK